VLVAGLEELCDGADVEDDWAAFFPLANASGKRALDKT